MTAPAPDVVNPLRLVLLITCHVKVAPITSELSAIREDESGEQIFWMFGGVVTCGVGLIVTV